jgi:cyclin B
MSAHPQGRTFGTILTGNVNNLITRNSTYPLGIENSMANTKPSKSDYNNLKHKQQTNKSSTNLHATQEIDDDVKAVEDDSDFTMDEKVAKYSRHKSRLAPGSVDAIDMDSEYDENTNAGQCRVADAEIYIDENSGLNHNTNNNNDNDNNNSSQAADSADNVMSQKEGSAVAGFHDNTASDADDESEETDELSAAEMQGEDVSEDYVSEVEEAEMAEEEEEDEEGDDDYDDDEIDPEGCDFEAVCAPIVLKWDQVNADRDLHVPQYINEIIANLRASEANDTQFDWCKFYDCDYMANQSDINPRMRHILVDWLVDVHRKFRLLTSTLFLGLNLLDRYLAKCNLHRSQLQLVGCVCMWTASKYHEIYAPEMEDFVYISDNAFTSADMIATETSLLKALEFNLTVPTVYSYTQRYCAISAFYLHSKREQEIISNLIQFCIENAAVSYDLCRCRPSLLAAAAFVYACIGTKVFTQEQFDADRISVAVGYEMSELIETMAAIHNLARNARKSKYKAITKKYSSASHSNVARLNFNKLRVQYLFGHHSGSKHSKHNNHNSTSNESNQKPEGSQQPPSEQLH